MTPASLDLASGFASAPPAYVRGIESPLPPGERVLWQGAPDRRALARHAFHERKLVVYFGVLLVFAALFASTGATPLKSFGVAATWLAVSAVVSVCFANVFAVLTTRATTYAITTRRIVMRTGIALPVVLNIPLRLIDGADLRRRAGGTGDIAIRLGGDVRVAYLVLWPHARAWRLRHPEPLLRGLVDAEHIGTVLGEALRTQAEEAGNDAPAVEMVGARRYHVGSLSAENAA